MKSRSLDKRVLLLLAKSWKERGIGGPYRTSHIYKGYSYLPDDYIAGELDKLNTEGDIPTAAVAAGLRTVWVNRLGADWPGGPPPDAEVRSLEELAELLEAMG